MEVLHAPCKDYSIHAGCKRHITPQGALDCRNRACQVRSWSFEEAGLGLEIRWKIGPFAHTCASVVGVSLDPSVVGRDWSPVSSNEARGYCCRTPGDHRAPLQPRRAARRYLRARGTSRADSRRSGAGLAPGPQALPMPAAALVSRTLAACCAMILAARFSPLHVRTSQ